MMGKPGDIWLKAAVAGSLWASVEIVVGSFLHNLRIPFAGTILAVMGISLMIAFQYKWKDSGLIWRAGVICAIMKSLSPSAIIIGPMLGILTEAILLDFSIRIFGRNVTGFLIGSIGAILSALIHKITTIIILYGFNIVTLLENVYQFAQKQLNLVGPAPKILLVYLILLYIVFGILAVIIGMASGKRLKNCDNLIKPSTLDDRKDEFSLLGDEKYSIVLLLFHFVVLVIGLYLIYKLEIVYSIIIILPYVVFVFYKYKRSLRRLAKPLFWFQLILILFFAVFFWNGYSAGSFLKPEGYIVGAKMIFRALIVVMVFSAISVELKNPIVKTVLYKRGFSKLYTSLGLAFSVLPGVMSRIAKPGGIIIRPINSLTQIILYSEDIYKSFKEQMDLRHPIFIIAGDQREGKTSFLNKTIQVLREHGINVDGIKAEGIDVNGERQGFNLVNVATGEKVLLCNLEGGNGWQQTGKYFFNPEGLNSGISKLNNVTPGSVLVVDEIGPLELNGGGWSNSLRKLLNDFDSPMIWVVRRNLTEKIILSFSLKNVTIMDIASYQPEELASQIIKLVSHT